MKKENSSPLHFKSLTEAHRALGLPNPKHPLISVIKNSCNPGERENFGAPHVLSIYKISYKPRVGGKLKYGQGYYDFDEGGLLFAAPGQIIGGTTQDTDTTSYSLFTLLIHPDFLMHHPLGKKIKQYGFFSYAVNEALHLSEEEKGTMISVFEMIEKELEGRIDDFSQDVVISQIELLLNYANRFYKRQFITRKAASNDLLTKLEEVLNNYFNSDQSATKGIPSVQFLADELNISASYLSDMLRVHTGKNAQQHIHDRLIEKNPYCLIFFPSGWCIRKSG